MCILNSREVQIFNPPFILQLHAYYHACLVLAMFMISMIISAKFHFISGTNVFYFPTKYKTIHTNLWRLFFKEGQTLSWTNKWILQIQYSTNSIFTKLTKTWYSSWPSIGSLTTAFIEPIFTFCVLSSMTIKTRETHSTTINQGIYNNNNLQSLQTNRREAK